MAKKMTLTPKKKGTLVLTPRKKNPIPRGKDYGKMA